MTISLITPVLLGLDGFAVCLALGPLSLGLWRGLSLAALFGVCDGLALLAGGVLHSSQPLNAAVLPVLIALWVMLVLALMIYDARKLLPVLPVLLAVDNLLAGIESGHAVLARDAALSCAVSALLAGAGLFAGRAIADLLDLPARRARLAGAGLLLAVGVVAIAG
jgi:hypothetical protein